MTTKGQRNDVVVVDEGTGHAGAITWWSLGGEVSRDVLVDTWEAAGLDARWHPYTPRVSTRLQRALRTLSNVNGHDRRVLVRPVGANGYALVDEAVIAVDAETGEETLRHTTRLTAKAHGGKGDDPAELTVTVLEPDDPERFPWRLPTETAVREAFADAEDWLTNHDLSLWLTRIATGMVHAVSLRNNGGFYYVPQAHLALWEEVVELLAFAAPACTVYRIPALRTDTAVKAVLDAVIADAEAALGHIRESVENGDLSDRARATRRRYCADIAKKLEAYSDLLGPALDAIKGQVVETHAQLSEDILAEDTPMLAAFDALVAA